MLQGIEIGLQMADDAIGAHQLDGADGILAPRRGRCSARLARRSAFGGGGLAAALAGQRADEFVLAGRRALLVAPPGGTAAQLGGGQALLAQAGEIGPPALRPPKSGLARYWA